MIDVLLLGTGGMMPLPNRWLSSLLVRTGGEMVLFDCGEGTQIPWQTSGWGFRRLGAICLSHLHADHVAGLPGLLHAVANSGRTTPVTIFGPPGTVKVVQALREIAPLLSFEVRIREVHGFEQFRLPGGAIGRAFQGDHGIPCNIYRVDLLRGRRFLAERAVDAGVPQEIWRRLQAGEDVPDGKQLYRSDDFLGPPRKGLSIGFVTDTRPVVGLPEFLEGVDLLVCEGTYGDSADHRKAVEKKHLTFAEAADIAASCGAGTLWLTHFSPAMSEPAMFLREAADRFPEVTVGYSGLSATLSYANGD